MPVALFGGVAAVAVMGCDINFYTQIGMIMLIGLAAENAILIVEFAMEQRAAGLSVIEAASQRFCAVMLTACEGIKGAPDARTTAEA